MSTESDPKFPHDCPRCQFLGGHDPEDSNDKYADLYYCEGVGDTPIVAARYGRVYDDYWINGTSEPSAQKMLNDAMRRAKILGFRI